MWGGMGVGGSGCCGLADVGMRAAKKTARCIVRIVDWTLDVELVESVDALAG